MTDKQIFSKSQILNRLNGHPGQRNQIKFVSFIFNNKITLFYFFSHFFTKAPYQVSKDNLEVNDNYNIAYANGDVLANVNNNNKNSAIEDLIASLPNSKNQKQQEQTTNFNLW